MVVTRFHPSWSWSIKLVQFHTGMVWPGIKMIQTEYRLVSVGVSVGPACFLQKHAKARFKHAWAVWKASQKKERTNEKKERKKESEALSEIDGLCSSEHGLWGIGFGGPPIGSAGFMSCFKVQGNFLLLCSSNNFVGYSYTDWGSWRWHATEFCTFKITHNQPRRCGHTKQLRCTAAGRPRSWQGDSDSLSLPLPASAHCWQRDATCYNDHANEHLFESRPEAECFTQPLTERVPSSSSNPSANPAPDLHDLSFYDFLIGIDNWLPLPSKRITRDHENGDRKR